MSSKGMCPIPQMDPKFKDLQRKVSEMLKLPQGVTISNAALKTAMETLAVQKKGFLSDTDLASTFDNWEKALKQYFSPEVIIDKDAVSEAYNKFLEKYKTKLNKPINMIVGNTEFSKLHDLYRTITLSNHQVLYQPKVISTDTTQSVKITQKLQSLPSNVALSNYVNEFKNVMEFCKTYFKFEPNGHKYFYQNSKGNWIEVATSVTSFIKNEKSSSGGKTIATELGNTWDSFVRDYFNNPVSFRAKKYPYVSNENKQKMIESLESLERYFDVQYGKGKYQVITQEFPLVAQLNGKSVGGIIDLVVVTDTGRIVIYDMKTTASPEKVSENAVTYSKQVTTYRTLLNTIAPTLTDRISIGGLIYAYPEYAKGYDYKVDDKKGIQVYDPKSGRLLGSLEDKRFGFSFRVHGQTDGTAPVIEFNNLEQVKIKSAKSLIETPMTEVEKEELFESSDIEETFVQQNTPSVKESKNQVIGENIVSSGSSLAKKLTNPGNSITVEYKGRLFKNAEHAYQTWKSGEFDEDAWNAGNRGVFKPVGKKKVNKEKNYSIMVEILTAKLSQHPELVEEINSRGGLAFIKASTHNMNDSFWGTNGQNKFIEALGDAYQNVAKKNLESSNIADKIVKVKESNWTRAKVEKDSKTLYIFTDNTDRSSGDLSISSDSWYAKKYGDKKRYPRSTTAQIRGLENAYPISTQRWCHKGATYEKGNWQDADAVEFEAVIKDEVDTIIEAWKSGKYERIAIPDRKDGFFNSRIANISDSRTPELKKILSRELTRLYTTIDPNYLSDTDTSIDIEEAETEERLETSINDVVAVSNLDDSNEVVTSEEKIFIAQNIFKRVLEACFAARENMTEDTDENPNFIRRYGLEELVTPEEIDSMSGLKLLKTKFNTIFDKILQTTILEYFPLEGLPDNLKAKYEWINNNYKSIMPYANGMALKYLGVSIVSNEQVDVLDVSESVDMFISGEKRIDEREAYIVPSREKEHITGLSSDIRMALSLIHDYQYELTDEGYQVKTETIDGVEYELYKTSMEGIDIPHYMPIEEVTPILIRLFNTARDSKELTKMVIKAKNQVPWLGQLEDRLLYDPKFGTLLFQVIQKNSTNYNRNILDSRKTGIKVSEPLNTRNTSRQLSSYVQSKYISTSSRPAFVNSDNTLNRVALNKLKTEFSTIQKAVRGRQNTDEKVDKLLTLLANLGIDNLDFTEILYTDEGESTFKNIVSAIDRAKIFTKISDAAAKNGVVTYGEISSPMYAIIEAVTPLIKGNIELTQRDGGKTYSTFTDSSFLESMIASLSSNNNLFEDYFDKYRAFSKVVKGNREYISDFLTMLKNNTNNVKYYLKHYARTTVPSNKGEGVSYLKQNRTMYLASLITDYFAPSVVNFYSNVKNSDLALFRIPIMSDKQASDSILFSKKAKVVADSSSDIRFPEEGINAIADSAFKYFIYELDRMKYILNQLANGKAENDIKTFIPKRKAAETQALIQAYKSNTLSGKYFSNSVIRTSGLSFRYVEMFQPLLEDENSSFGKAIIAYLNGKPLSIKNQDAFRTIWKNALEEKYQALKAEINSLYGTKKTPGYIAIFNTIATTEYSKNKRLPKLSSAAAEAYLKEYFYNDYWATLNILNITSIDPAFYKNTIDFQKRNAQMHSATQRGDAKATFVSDDGYDDVSVSDGYHRILIIKDKLGDSPLAEVGGVLSKTFEKAANTETNPKRKKELLELAEKLPAFFKGYDVCDGQAYSSPTGFFKRMTMLGEDTYEFRKLLDKINKGDFNIDDLKKVSQQPYKPFTYGWSEKKVGDTLMPVPMQVKDSESMLLIAGILLRQAKVDHPLRILFDFMEASMYNDLDAFFNSKSLEEYEKHLETTPHELNSDTYNPAGLDTIAFDTAIKEGASGVLDLNKASFEEIQNELKKTVKGNTWNDSYIHKIPAMAWGKQQEVPGHMQDHEQSFGSQAKVLSSTDIEDNETVVINGKEYTGKKVKEAYFKLLAKDLSDAVKSITKDITDDVIYSQDYINKLSKKIRASISRDAKFSSDLFNAFSVFDTMGNLIAPIKDPAYSDKALSTIFSEIRKKVNDQLMPGGPIVQQAPFGLDDTLNIVDSKGKSFREADFNPLDGGIVYETYITCPSSELEAKLTKRDGSLMTIDEAKKAGILTDKDLEFISYRIPTEDKYSIFRCKIKGFLSRRGGETIIMPADIVPMSGTDFDIDKMFTIFRCNDYMKLTHIPKESYKTKNEIFNYMWGMLGSKNATLNHLTPGNFEELKEMAKDIDLNRAGNPNIAYVTTQIQLQESNAAGKTFVGIAALNNTAHGINSQVGIAFKIPEFNFKIEGKSITDLIENINGENVVPFDTVYSKFDGNRISKTLCKFVGASADNAKETLLGSLNYSSTTATLAMGMLRFGIPLTTVTYMLNLPRVQELIKTAVLSEKSLTSVLNKAVDNIESKEKASEYNITYKELQQEIRKFNNSKLEGKEYKHNEKLTNAVLTFLYNFNDYAQNIQDVNILCGLNSTKNAVGPSGYETVIQEYKIKEAEALFEKGHIATKLEDYYKAVPHVKILRDIYADAEGKQRVVPSLTSRLAYPVSALYNNNFRSVLEKLENQFKVNIGRMNVATLKHLFNSFLVYQAGKKKVIDVNKVSDIIYGTPLALINNRDKFEKNRLLSDMYIRNNPSRYNGTYEINLNSKVPSEVKDLQSASWANLISKRENREFSNILMTYNILKFGFDWNPKSALNVAPVTARLAIPGYKNIFEDTMNDMWEATDFIVEYAANNPTSDIVRDVTKVANDEEVQDLTTYSAQEFVDNARNPMSIESKLLAKIDSPIIGGFDDGNIIIKVNENDLYVVEAKGGNGMFYEYNVDKSIVDASMAKKQKNSLSDLATINESDDSNTDETETTEYTRKEDEDISEVLDTIDTALDNRQTITNLQKIAQSLESIKDDASGIFLPKYNEVVDKAISKLTNLNTKKADIKKQVLTNLNSLCR